MDKLTLGEIAKKLGISIFELLVKIRTGTINYELDNGNYSFPEKQKGTIDR